MFNEEAFKKLKNNKYFKIFSFNCYLGFFITYTIAMLIVLGIIILCFKDKNLYEILASVLNYYIPLYLIGTVALIVLTAINLKKKPYLCCIGKVKSKTDSRAIIEVNGEEIKGTSFEHFVKSQNLKDYNQGDEVIVYSSVKKHGRPLFFKA